MINVLILCTGNSCRSILGEALINNLGQGRVKAFSAGSRPLGRVNPNALATLARNGLPTEGFTSQSWDAFAEAGIDVAITVCDQAADEVCPVYLHDVVRAHWGLPDPAHATGTDEEINRAFQATYDALQFRIEAMLALPLEALARNELAAQLEQINVQGNEQA